MNIVSGLNISLEENIMLKTLEKYQEESFNKEKQLYGNEYPNFNKLCYAIEEDYEDFQQTLVKLIFGNDYAFLFYFCNNDFIKSIITTGTGRIENVLGHNELIELRKNIAERGNNTGRKNDIKNKNNVDSEENWYIYNLTNLPQQSRTKAIKYISNKITEKTFNKFINELILNADEKQTKNIKKYYQQTLQETFLSFGFRYREKGEKKAKTIDIETKDKQGNKILKQEFDLIYLSSDENGMKIRQNQQAQLYFDKNDLLKILKKTLQDLPKKFEGQDQYKNIKINLTTAKNEFLINFEAQKEEKKDDFNNKTLIKQISTVFYEVVYNKLPIEQDSFDAYWKSGGQNNFEALGEEKLKKILTANTEASVSGELGEAMTAIFLQGLPSKQKRLVQIFGQTKGKTGDAAVDVGLIKEEIGFQVKNYSSISETIALYTQSTDLMTDDIFRYLSRVFINEFIQQIKTKYTIEKEEEIINQNLVKLNNHIPFFLRYGEAEGAAEEVANYRNNFYIINFKIIPASYLFYLLNNLIKNTINQINTENSLFYFSSKKEDPGRNQILSYQNPFDTYKQAHENYLKNQKSFYINFRGIKIQFKEELKILI